MSTATKTVAILVAHEGIERVELTEPRQALHDAGFDTHVVSTRSGTAQTFDHLDKAEEVPVDRTVEDVTVEDYDALLMPGGVANPDVLRMQERAVAFARDFLASGKPVAAICHAPWTLVEADVVRGRRLTSWPSLQTDVRNAGGEWADEEVVVDGNLITSRGPDDIQAFSSTLIEAINHGPDSAASTAAE